MKKIAFSTLLLALVACQNHSISSGVATQTPYLADVVIDAGGGSVGAQNATDNLVLALAQDLKIRTNQKGLNTYLTRSGQYEKPLTQRVEDANKRCRGVFVALTMNDEHGDVGDGIRVTVLPQQQAGAFYERNIGVGDVLRAQLADNRPLQEYDEAILKNTACPSVLVQLGKTGNPQDQARLSDPLMRAQLATALANSIDQALIKK